MTREELLNRISAKELRDWEVFAAVEPFGEERADLRSAIIAHTVALGTGIQKKDKSPLTVSEFLASSFLEPSQQQSSDSIKMFFRGISPGQK